MAQLREVCELIVDCEHKTAPTQETGYPSIRTPNIGRGRLLLDGVNRVSEETYHAWTQREVPRPGDLILAREAPIGNVAIIPPGLKVCLGQRTVLIRPHQKFVNPQYLTYLLLGDEIQGKILSISNGATVHHLNMKDIRELDLPALPDLGVQRRIASVLSAYDDLIENNTRRIKVLEEMAQMIYREWFVNFRFPGHEKVRMVESELGPIPKGWQLKRVSDIARVNGLSIKSSSAPERINYIDIASVSTGRIEKIEPYCYDDAPGRARRIVKHGDTIWSTVRPNRRSYALIVNPDTNLIVSTGFAVLTASAVPFSYLHLAVTTDEFADYLTNHATGSAYPAVTGKEFEQAVLVVPPAALLVCFHEIVEPMLSVCWCHHQRNRNLRTTRDLLLPKLISGEVPVEAAEETAAELMEATA